MGKSFLREQTGYFLDKASNKATAYRLSAQDSYFSGAENIYATETQTKVVSNSTPELTGARPAILPMHITTIGQDGKTAITFTMLINPETWNEGKGNSFQSSYTRSGWIPQLWGPNQDTVSSTGTTAAFMTPNGLDNYLSEMSFGYLNLLALITAYRSNGYEFEDFTALNNITRVISKVRGVQICYDNQILMGHFNNFTLDENETTPFLQKYNFEFIVSALSGTETEIRGHYEPLPPFKIAGTPSIDDTIHLVADPTIKPPQAKIVLPKPEEDTLTRRMWAQVTGLPWSEAFNLRQTDGTVQGNLILRGKLMSGKWDSNTKTFKTGGVSTGGSIGSGVRRLTTR